MSRNINNSPDKKRRVWFIELYPDSTTYNCSDLINVVKSFPEWAIILHDKDVKPDGELKKPHYHCVVRTSPALLSTILNKFPGLASNFIEFSHEFQWCVRYLIHLDDVSKYQYQKEAVETNIEDIERYWRTQSELSYVWHMADMRSSGASWYSILSYCKDNHCYDIFRRNVGIIQLVANEAACHVVPDLDFDDI